MGRITIKLVVLAALAGLAVAGPARGSSTVGLPVANLESGSKNGCVASIKCTYYQARGPGGLESPAYSVPFDGMIVRWRVGSGSSTGDVTLRVIRPVGTKFTGAGTGTQRTLVMNGVSTFEGERLPVKAGDTIGVDNESSALFFGTPGLELAEVRSFQPYLPDSGSPQNPVNSYSTERLELDADVVALPSSTALPSACPNGAGALVAVTADPDPVTGPKAVRFRVDGGTEQAIATTGNPGVAAVTVPAGVHQLEFWGEDALGQQEATHHSISAGCAAPPSTPGAGSGGKPGTAAAPVLSGVSQSATRWRAGNALARLSTRKAPLGTTFAFTLNVPARAAFTFTQPVPGRRVGGKCVAPGRTNSRKPKCTRTLTRGALSFGAHAGINKVQFQGRISPSKRLTPGSYTLTIKATDASGRRSRQAALNFTIVKR